MILYNTNADDFGACICWFLQVLYLSFLLAPHWAPERRLKATVTVSFYSSLPNLMEPEPILMDPLPILMDAPLPVDEADASLPAEEVSTAASSSGEAPTEGVGVLGGGVLGG